MGTYISVATVRRTVGIDSTEINDDDVNSIIIEIEVQVPRRFNTVYVPTEVLDILDGDGTNRLRLDNNPILSVRELKIDGTTVDPADLEIKPESGYIFLGEGADTSKFINKRNRIVIKYIHGTLTHSKTTTLKTTSSAATTAGTSVAISVASLGTFADEDWVEIYGMDGYREVAQINTTPSAGVITVDQLVQTHESGSFIVKLEVDANFTKVMNIVAGIAMVARIIGQSYDENTGYSLGELRIQKGEPYTQWREAANQLIKERDSMIASLGIRPYII